ncbi:MAG: hypothetical protein ACW987_00620 [Candidatus Thorarchaeota archaeon]|jgi:hypothetical protein
MTGDELILLTEYLPETIPTWLAGIIGFVVLGYLVIKKQAEKPRWVRRYQCKDCGKTYNSYPSVCQDCGGSAYAGSEAYWFDGKNHIPRKEWVGRNSPQ